ERHHLEFVLGGRRALEHPAIKYKGLAEGEAFVSNLKPQQWGVFYWARRTAPANRTPNPAICNIRAASHCVHEMPKPLIYKGKFTLQMLTN
ncbi:hypothetical protein ACQUJS_23220, partial [Ralstonia pseudosolanacearum]